MLNSMIPATVLALCTTVTLAVQPIEIKGSDFINPVTGNRFQIVGVAYQPGGSSGYTPGNGDPLSDGAVCRRDAALMQKLGINAIRAYNVDGTLNHDECASIFNDAGIYMMLDVNSPVPGESIDRTAPANSYHSAYLQRIFAVVEAFKDYPNTLLFFSGNEVINDLDTGKTVGPYMRAVTRDLKNYIAKHSSRPIPVGYSAADVREILLDSWNYLQCTTTGDNSDPSRVDVFALNSYSWCGESTVTTSGYSGLAVDFNATSVPVFFSEYGCNVPYPRIFTEVEALYSPLLLNTLGGGVVYEYTQGPSNYGLVTINADGSAELLSDYNTLQSRFNALDMATIQGTKPKDTAPAAPKCDVSLLSSSSFSTSWSIPAVPEGGEDLINHGIKNPKNGKIIKISDFKVTQKISDAAGNVLSDLAVQPLPDDQSNAPSGQITGANATSKSESSSSSSNSSSSSSSLSSHSGNGTSPSSSQSGSGSGSSSDHAKNSAARKIEGSMFALVAILGLGFVAL